MYLVGVPLLIVPFAIYNIFAFLIPGVDWAAPFMSVTLRSGAEWRIAPGEVLVAFSILILLVELVKLTRIGWRSWVDHLLSFALFAGMTSEFILVRTVASPTFFLLLVIGFVDFFGGIVSALAARARRRELVIERAPVAYPVPDPKPSPQPAPAIKPEPTPSEPSPA
jgi:hypothetical protein